MKRFWLFFPIVCFWIGGSGSALATLGEKESSVDNDIQIYKGSKTTTETEAYTVHELLLNNGTSIKEYVSHAGLVFAATWHGLTQPDLTALLGRYYSEYASTVATTPPQLGN